MNGLFDYALLGDGDARKVRQPLTADFTFHNAADDLGAERLLLAYKGRERFSMRGGVEAMPLIVAMNEINAVVRA